ncbi:ciliary microtubule inner protein 1 isoform X1 [Cinclus cinclus]|uniref:ciliary microtubule inner protein 1 isoform X1 n=1 Tax=Cinclus cinclus TaxID=127875 RepID=UPI002E158F05
MEPGNFIAQDNYWKKHVEKEEDAAKRWAEKWGFLKTSPEELIGDEKKEDAKPKLQLPDHLQIRPVTPVEKYIKVRKLDFRIAIQQHLSSKTTQALKTTCLMGGGGVLNKGQSKLHLQAKQCFKSICLRQGIAPWIWL